jgi:hypothetical protein
MPLSPEQIVTAHAAGATVYPNGRPLAPDAGAAWTASTNLAAGRLGAATVADSARRAWRVEAHRDARGRSLIVSPVRGDNEPFRASADGHRPGSWLAISATDWALLAVLCAGREGDAGREDEELRAAAFPVVDRLVREAQHQQLMGAAEDDDE